MNQEQDIIRRLQKRGMDVPESCQICKNLTKKDGEAFCSGLGRPVNGSDYGCCHWKDSKGRSAVACLIQGNKRNYRRKTGAAE